MISWQGLEQEDDLIGFWGNETTIFLNDEVASSRVDNSQTGFKREEKSVEMAIWFKIPAQKRNLDKEPSQENSMVVTRLRVGASLLEAP
jgi:hypothetical protein